jgi:uncharacterized protein
MYLENHGFSFHTKNGNQYNYNDLDGTICPANGFYDEKNKKESAYNSPIIREKDKTELDIKKVLRNFLLTEGFTQLQLIVTEQCNLRCKYCVFSGIYLHNRTHNNSFMNMTIAEKAIRKYYEGVCIIKQKNPSFRPAISFYGGEPLLNFELISNVTNFVKYLFKGKVIFNVTTNGTLMTKEMIDFFIENDFRLMFSLNGDREEHNRLRTYADNSGSYDILWQNMQKIRHKDARYYREKCSLSIVYDYGTNIRRLYEFLKTRSQLLPQSMRFGSINNGFSEWYSQYSSQDITSFSGSFQYLLNLFVHYLENNKYSNLLKTMVGTEFTSIMSRTQNFPFRNSLMPYTGTCIPGSKIAVRPDGTFLCCERINSNFPIGNADTGLDTRLIEALIIKYREQIYTECYSCPITRLCTFCFATLCADSGQFKRDPTDMCQKQILKIKNVMSILWTMFENGITEDSIMKSDDSIDLGCIEND